MAWIAIVPPSARHPHERYQVRYQDGTRQRSAGIFGVHGAVAEHYGTDPKDSEPHATTLDYLVAAAAG
jgi:hypothetical protein